MTMTQDDKILDATFAQMRDDDVIPSEALLNRIMVDADSVLERPAATLSRPKQGFGAMVLDVIGGWPSFGGLAAATVAGLWIGVAPPAALADLSASYLGSTIEVPLFGIDVFLDLAEVDG